MPLQMCIALEHAYTYIHTDENECRRVTCCMQLSEQAIITGAMTLRGIIEFVSIYYLSSSQASG